MAKANYTVDNAKKIIVVKMETATEKDMRAVMNYQKLGYTIKPFEKVKKTEEELKASKFSKGNVEKYLDKNGTPEQKARYKAIKEEQVIDKETNEPKFTKTGKPVKKGYIAALKYFRKEFPDY